MPLEEVILHVEEEALPADVASFLEEADRRITIFLDDRRDQPIPGFVPSGFEKVYLLLRYIEEHGVAPGGAFCEWGSGYGVVAALAAMLEYDACGIEIDRDLVDSSMELVEDFGLPVELVQGSFVPAGGQAITDQVTESAWLSTESVDGYDELGVDPHDFDVIYAYPWPGEEHVIQTLFEQYAGVGALLVLYLGINELMVYRKT
ncbi:MAG: class I SAM-dependent methyltransferase [Planctomycetota bacterium]|jgi:hypothetical protein